MLGEERLSHCIEGDIILRPDESMSFIRKEYIGHREISLLHSQDHLSGFTLIDYRIIGTLSDEQWPSHTICIIERRPFRKQFPSLFGAYIAHEVCPANSIPVIIRRNVFLAGGEIRHAADVHSTGEDLWREG